LISDDEASNALEFGDRFVILPVHGSAIREHWRTGRPVPSGFRYASDTNEEWLDIADFDGLILKYPELAELLHEPEKEEADIRSGVSQA
jgi:UDP-N-acetylglucosamine 4,6-dehydratase